MLLDSIKKLLIFPFIFQCFEFNVYFSLRLQTSKPRIGTAFVEDVLNVVTRYFISPQADWVALSFPFLLPLPLFRCKLSTQNFLEPNRTHKCLLVASSVSDRGFFNCCMSLSVTVGKNLVAGICSIQERTHQLL